MWFSFGRQGGFPTQYAENRTPVTVDVLDCGFILAAVILAFCFYISITGARLKENIYAYIRITISIMIGAMIIIGNFGQEWEVGHINTKTAYKAGTGVEINASIGIKIGLRSVNVTLKSDVDPSGPLKREVIDYNERFHWAWDQGRFGFGPYAGRIQREFRQAQYEGVPLPILWVVDYFVIDGEGFRFGRFYRTAGWYAHIAMWTAFPLWLLANIFFRSVLTYGAYCLGMAGVLQLVANLLWAVIRNPNALVIPFEDANLTTTFGTSYWLTFSSGIISLISAIAIYVCQEYFHTETHNFFGVDPLNAFDTAYITPDEAIKLKNSKSIKHDDIQLRNMPEETPLLGQPGSSNARPPRQKTIMIHVKKNHKLDPHAVYDNLVSHRRKARDVEEQPEYDNVTASRKNQPPIPMKILPNSSRYAGGGVKQPQLPPLPPKIR